MATKSSLPAVERPGIKPTRSMTHPLRDPKTNGAPRRRVKQGEPFDPEELSRKLQAHLVEQKLKAQQRRQARAAKAAEAEALAAALHAQDVYHHVPAVAARDMERTTTPIGKDRKMHKLAEPVVKAHLARVSVDENKPSQPLTLLQKTIATDQAILENHLLRNRNQFQWTHEMEEAAEADEDRDLYKPPQRTFNGEFAHLMGTHKKGAPRPLSMGDMFWEEDGSSPPQQKPKPKPKLAPHDIVNDHRNDWAQRDDEMENRKKDKASPFLRKMESSWMLMGKKEKSRRDEGISGFGSSPPEGGKVKGSFLARFKRHPS